MEKSSRRKLLIGTSVLAVIAATGSAMAFGAKRMMGKHGMAGPMVRHQVERLMDHVDATEDQRAHVDALTREFLEEHRERHDSMGQMRDQFAASIGEDGAIDFGSAEEQRKEALAAFDAGSQRAMAFMQEVHEVLTPEQQKKAGQLLKQKMEKHQHRRGEDSHRHRWHD